LADDNFSTEITLRSGDHEAKLPAIAQPILQALHNALVGVEETYKTSFRKPSICQSPDIEQLIHLLEQWIDAYGPLSQSATITCIVRAKDKMKGDKRLSFKSLQSFLKNYSGITDPTKSIVISFSSILKIADKDTLDKIYVDIELRSTLPAGFVEAIINKKMSLDEDEDEDEDEDKNLAVSYRLDFNNITASIRYTNYLVAKGMLNVIEGWFHGLEEIETLSDPTRKLRMLFQDDFFEIFPVSKFLVYSLSLAVPAAILVGKEEQISAVFGLQNLTSSQAISFFVFIGIFVFGVFRFLLQSLQSSSAPRSRHLLLNNGDQRAMEKYKIKRRKSSQKRKLLTNTIAIGFLVSVLASLAVALL